MAVTRGAESSDIITRKTAKLYKASNKSSRSMVKKGCKTSKSKKKYDDLPYISPKRIIIKARLRNIYIADPI